MHSTQQGGCTAISEQSDKLLMTCSSPVITGARKKVSHGSVNMESSVWLQGSGMRQ